LAKWIVGNWKMNGSRTHVAEFAAGLLAGFPAGARNGAVRVGVCPPAPYLPDLGSRLEGSPVLLGAQNVHPWAGGAYTGEVSAPMLADLGVKFCIAGHSERRHLFRETDAFIREKLAALLEAKLMAILCVGETLAQREAGEQTTVVQAQLTAALEGFSAAAADRLLVAYEPVWAIGTGKTAQPQQAQEMHAFVRQWLKSRLGDLGQTIPILYGGSVTPDNARALLQQPDINGALVGGASLKVESFLAIIQQAIN